MSMNISPVIAICYDFDGTLSPGNMQEHGFLQELGMEPEEFWLKCEDFCRRRRVDRVLGYMRFMRDVTSWSPVVKIRLASAAGLRLQSPDLMLPLTFTPTGKVSCSACTLPARIFPAFPVFTSASWAWILV